MRPRQPILRSGRASATRHLSARPLAAVALASLVLGALGPAACVPARSPDRSADVAALRALHEKVMRAHREGDAEMLLADESADSVVAGRGEVSRPTIEERRARFAAYFGSTTFQEYRDLVEPVVSVSDDGTLGWVVAQVHAQGVQKAASGAEEPLTFDSAWVELYRKSGGRWYRVGNVSNFKP